MGGCRAGQCRGRGGKAQGLDKEGLDFRDGKSLRKGVLSLDAVRVYADLHAECHWLAVKTADHQSVVDSTGFRGKASVH